MIEIWKKQLENGEKVGVIFMDISKAFDTTNHSLLLAKLKSSIINEGIRVILNLLIFFLQEDFTRTKSTKTHTSKQKRQF